MMDAKVKRLFDLCRFEVVRAIDATGVSVSLADDLRKALAAFESQSEEKPVNVEEALQGIEMSEETEVIKHAAVIAKDGRFLMGKSHADCFHQAKNIGVETHSNANCQGFISSKGRFLDRKEAAVVAVEAGQVRNGIEILFSEDLWSPHADGQFQYDYVKGYY